MKILAVAIVIIVVVAAVAVYFVSGSDNGGEDDGSNIDSQLAVYGNADGNYTIDQNDLDIVNDIIAGNETLADNPLADANADGVVDSEDADLVQTIIDRDPCTMYVHCIGTDDRATSVAIQYPLDNFVLQGTNNDSIICEMGIADKCAGYFYIYENAHSSLVAAGSVDLGGGPRSISEQAWQNFIDLDSDVGVGAIIADAGSGALEDYYASITDSQIPLLRFAASDTYDSISAALTIGFICGSEYEETAYNYVSKCWDAFDYIDNALSGLSDDDRKVFLSITMGRYIAHTESDFTHKAEYAGGLNIGDVDSSFASTYSGDGSTRMQSPEALSNYDSELDYIFSFRTVDYRTDLATFVTDEWDEYKSYYENLDSYENFVIINGMLPQICQTAYAAAIMYPDLVSMEWADDLMQSFVEDSQSGYTMDDVITVFTYDDYQAYTASA